MHELLVLHVRADCRHHRFMEVLGVDIRVFKESLLSDLVQFNATGPNLGKLAVWTRTINRQDQLVIQSRSPSLHPLVKKLINRGSTLNETKKNSKKTS